MIRPILVCGQNLESTRTFGQRLADVLGVGVREVFGGNGEVIDREFAKNTKEVWCTESDFLLDRERRIRCLFDGFVIRVSEGETWSVNGCGRGDAEKKSAGNKRVTELIEAEFREVHTTVNPSKDGIENCVEKVRDLLERKPIVVAIGEQSYLVEVGRGNVERRLVERQWGAPVGLYVTDENVERLHGKRLAKAVAGTGMRIEKVVLKPGEESKNLATLNELFDKALEAGIDRTSWLIAAGGGVVTDISGLVAALWMRGIRWIGIPTTMLSMVDASVGGKTAIDYGMGKNAVGAFWHPSAVICDVEWLLTESERNYVGGLAEVVKTAIIGDEKLMSLLEDRAEEIVRRDLNVMEEVVRRCVQVKAKIVSLDAREGGLRAVLNLGHTVGHALEALGKYKKYTHGEAVSLGMVAALRLGQERGNSPRDVVRRVETVLGRLGLPTELPRDELAGASELLGHDKKRAGSSVRFVFAHAIEDVRSEKLVLEDLREWVVGLSSRS